MRLLRFFFSPSRRIGWLALLGGAASIAALEFLVALLREPWLMLAAALLACIPLYCLFAKRLHDMGQSAWPATIFVTAEAVVAFLGFSYATGSEYALGIAAAWEPDKLLAARELGLVGMLLSSAVVIFFVWGLIGPRTFGDNRFGPEPAR